MLIITPIRIRNHRTYSIECIQSQTVTGFAARAAISWRARTRDSRSISTRSRELGHFLEQLAPAGEEEAEPVGEVVDVDPWAGGGVDIGDAVDRKSVV